MNAFRKIGSMGFDAAANGAEVIVEAGNVVVTAADIAAATAEGVSLGDKIRKVATNKYVVGGVAAVAVAAAAYGTYRYLKKDEPKKAKKSKAAPAAVEMTEEQAAAAVEAARVQLQAAEAVLTKSKAKKAGKKDTATA